MSLVKVVSGRGWGRCQPGMCSTIWGPPSYRWGTRGAWGPGTFLLSSGKPSITWPVLPTEVRLLPAHYFQMCLRMYTCMSSLDVSILALGRETLQLWRTRVLCLSLEERERTEKKEANMNVAFLCLLRVRSLGCPRRCEQTSSRGARGSSHPDRGRGRYSSSLPWPQLPDLSVQSVAG